MRIDLSNSEIVKTTLTNLQNDENDDKNIK